MAVSWKSEKGEECGPWIPHDGCGCPLPPGTIVEVMCVDGFGLTMRHVSHVTGDPVSSWNWRFAPRLRRIVRYREKKPRGLTMLEECLRKIDVLEPLNLS